MEVSVKPFPVFRGVFLQSLCVSCCQSRPSIGWIRSLRFCFLRTFFFGGGGWGGGAAEDLLPIIVLGVQVVKF